MTRGMSHASLLPAFLVGAALVFLIVFAVAYPRVFPVIEAAHPDHFERNVDHALKNGDIDRALSIARRAVAAGWSNPSDDVLFTKALQHTVYGRVLLQAQRRDEALEQFQTALSLSGEAYPPFKATRQPYFFAPARLSLGEYAFAAGHVTEAVAHFELGRVDSRRWPEAVGPFRATVANAYARQRLWARVLEVGGDVSASLDKLSTNDLQVLARVGEGRGDWPLVASAAEELLRREPNHRDGLILLGKVKAREGALEEAVGLFQRAADAGHVDANYHLGRVLERAGQTYGACLALTQVPEPSVYQPYALARALQLYSRLSETERDLLAATHDELLNALEGAIDAMRKGNRPQTHDPHSRFRLEAYRLDSEALGHGGRFPLSVVWHDQKAQDTTPDGVTIEESPEEDTIVLRRGASTVLQLQWVENLVNWAAVDVSQPNADVVPGWIDSAREWFNVRKESAVNVERVPGHGNVINVRKLSWYYSAPIAVEKEDCYLLAGQVNASEGKCSLDWQALDATERVLSAGSLSEGVTRDGWTHLEGHFRKQSLWRMLRVQLAVAPRAPKVSFDDVMLIRLRVPKTASSPAAPPS